MSTKHPRSNRQHASGDSPDAGNSAAAPDLSEAARAWTALVDGWWRQQSAVLPPELERAMSSMLGQSKALVDMACAQAVRAFAASAAGANPAQVTRSRDSGSVDELGLWQPVIDACRACEASLVGNVDVRGSSQPGAANEYQRAAVAYMNEFVQINSEVAKRLQKKLAIRPPADFRQLHDLVVEEVENAYRERVSTDSFAALQAAFINAMFRLRKETTKASTVDKP